MYSCRNCANAWMYLGVVSKYIEYTANTGVPGLTIPVSVIASNAARAEDDLAYLQKTTPFVAIRSVLQYCRS